MYISVKILLFPVVFALLVYFRAVIFQPHISQYADDAQIFLEQRYDISIPLHVVENTGNEIDVHQQPVSSQSLDSDYATDILLDKSIIGDSSISDASSEDKTSVKDNPVDVMTRVVEQEIFIILNNDSSKKSSSNDLVDNVNEEVMKTETETGTTVETDVGKQVAETKSTPKDEVNEEDLQSISQEITNGDTKVIDPAVMAKLSDTIDIINRKVDMLFNINEINKDTKITAENSDDFAIIKNKKNKIESEPAIAASSYVKPSHNTQDMLLVARQAFWNGNPLDSEKLYLDLVKLHENNPNVYGELGNVYYSQGKWEKAGKAYYQAAVRLLDLKQTQQVNYLLRVIQGLDIESAEKLKLKISG